MTAYYQIAATNETATSNLTLPPIFIAANSHIRAHVMMVHAGHGGQTNAWGMDVYISQYVQNGILHSGAFRFLEGQNITELVLRADVSGGSVVGTMIVEYL